MFSVPALLFTSFSTQRYVRMEYLGGEKVFLCLYMSRCFARCALIFHSNDKCVNTRFLCASTTQITSINHVIEESKKINATQEIQILNNV